MRVPYSLGRDFSNHDRKVLLAKTNQQKVLSTTLLLRHGAAMNISIKDHESQEGSTGNQGLDSGAHHSFCRMIHVFWINQPSVYSFTTWYFKYAVFLHTICKLSWENPTCPSLYQCLELNKLNHYIVSTT